NDFRSMRRPRRLLRLRRDDRARARRARRAVLPWPARRRRLPGHGAAPAEAVGTDADDARRARGGGVAKHPRRAARDARLAAAPLQGAREPAAAAREVRDVGALSARSRVRAPARLTSI